LPFLAGSLLIVILFRVVLFITLLIVGYIQYALSINDFVRIFFAVILAVVVVSVLWLPDLYGDRLIPPDDLEIATNLPRDAAKKAEEGHEYESFASYRDASSAAVTDDPSGRPKAMAETGVSYPDCFYGESIPILESVNTWRFWCLYVIYFTVSGTGLMVIYNVDAIAEALSVYPSSFFVTLISLANGAGRSVISLDSEPSMLT
jgi:hypothetical protein